MSLLGRGLRDLHIPSRCAVCGVWPTAAPTTPWCADCLAHWAAPTARCQRCARRLESPARICGLCLTHPPALDQCIAAVDYAFPWPAQVHTLKGLSGASWGRPLARLMTQAWLTHAQLRPGTQTIWAPIPLHWRRLMQRGHNQSWSLLRHIAQSEAFQPTDSAAPDLLERPRPHEVQHQLDRAARQRNTRFAFELNQVWANALHTGRPVHVVLIDDVYTTGATLNAAAKVIKAHGPITVSALVFARTPPVESQ